MAAAASLLFSLVASSTLQSEKAAAASAPAARARVASAGAAWRGISGSSCGWKRKVRGVAVPAAVRAMAMADGEVSTGSKVEEKLGVRIERNPAESRLSELGVRSWPKWGCPASTFPWTYDGKETCYLLQGKVRVYPEWSSDFVEFGAGDLVVFPKGMSCTWEVSAAVDKHYQFEY